MNTIRNGMLCLPVTTVLLGPAAGCYSGSDNAGSVTDGGASSSDGSSEVEPTGTEEPDGEDTGDTPTTGSTGEPAPELCWDLEAVCAPVAPPGWAGPFALFDGPADESPSCPPELPELVLTAYEELEGPAPAECGACACDTPSGGTCGSVPVTAYQMPDVGACGGCVTEYQLTPGVCTPVLACGDPLGSIVMQPAPASGGACTPSGPSVDLPPIAWNRQAIGCGGALDVPGCAAGQTCMGAAPPPFGAGVCISHPGVVDCPGPPYVQLQRYYLDAKDERGCTPCSCGPSHDAHCEGTLTLYHHLSPGCGVPEAVYNVPADCTWKSVHPEVMVALDPPQGGACDPGASAPTGTVNPDQQVTVCCGEPVEPGPVG